MVDPHDALELLANDVAGWRISVVDTGDRAAVLNALARTEAAYLRTGRSSVADAASLVGLPSISSRVSVFVDSVEEAVAAIDAGAGDLLLRDWDSESLAELRDVVPDLVERTAVPPSVTVDQARRAYPRDLYKVYLDQIDASGAARPRYGWAPGVEEAAPIPDGRLSAAWSDDGWRNRVGGWSISDDVRGILDRSLDGVAPTRDEIERLFRARGDEVEEIASVANTLRERANGDTVTYVVNRNINYTNQCYFRCGFCAFSKGPRSLNLRGDPYLMTIPRSVCRAASIRSSPAIST